jgi:hypothetical protein
MLIVSSVIGDDFITLLEVRGLGYFHHKGGWITLRWTL